jgi:hypothetical protein
MLLLQALCPGACAYKPGAAERTVIFTKAESLAFIYLYYC